jgi:hypothetical protein
MSFNALDDIPGLLNEIVFTHVLGEGNKRVVDLARLRAVSRGMLNAVNKTGRRVEKPQ